MNKGPLNEQTIKNETENQKIYPCSYVNSGTQGNDFSNGFQENEPTKLDQINQFSTPSLLNQDNFMNKPRFIKPSISFQEFLSRHQQNENLEGPKQFEAIYELLKQQNEMRDNQQKQYEQITRALSDSIDAKNNKELELSNRMKTCVETIEKTFSNGTFDRIVQGISEMVKTITENQNKEMGDVKQIITNCKTEIDGLKALTNKFQTEQGNKENDNDDLRDRIDYLEEAFHDSLHDSSEKLETYSELAEDSRKIVDGMIKKIEQQDILIGKLCLAVYNIDETLINKIFTADEMEKITAIQSQN